MRAFMAAMEMPEPLDTVDTVAPPSPPSLLKLSKTLRSRKPIFKTALLEPQCCVRGSA